MIANMSNRNRKKAGAKHHLGRTPNRSHGLSCQERTFDGQWQVEGFLTRFMVRLDAGDRLGTAAERERSIRAANLIGDPLPIELGQTLVQFLTQGRQV